ncbi:YdeI/OmpD-associated family protein, partial [Corynebacterium bovis]
MPGGAVHGLPDDLRDSLLTSDVAREAWLDITTLARNEFICWVEDAKKPETRARRIRRTNEELE